MILAFKSRSASRSVSLPANPEAAMKGMCQKRELKQESSTTWVKILGSELGDMLAGERERVLGI